MSAEALYKALVRALKPFWKEHGYVWNSPSDRAESVASGVRREITIYRAGRPRMSLPVLEAELEASVRIVPVTDLLRAVFGGTGPGEYPPRLHWGVGSIPGVKRYRFSSKDDAPDIAKRMAVGIAACDALLEPMGTLELIDAELASAAHLQLPLHRRHDHHLMSLCLAHLLGLDVAARAELLEGHVPPDPSSVRDFARLRAALLVRVSRADR